MNALPNEIVLLLSSYLSLYEVARFSCCSRALLKLLPVAQRRMLVDTTPIPGFYHWTGPAMDFSYFSRYPTENNEVFYTTYDEKVPKELRFDHLSCYVEITFKVDMKKYKRLQKEHHYDKLLDDFIVGDECYYYFDQLHRVVHFNLCNSYERAVQLLNEIYPLLWRSKIPTRKLRFLHRRASARGPLSGVV